MLRRNVNSIARQFPAAHTLPTVGIKVRRIRAPGGDIQA
jgi:hypothetical protein